MYWTNKIKVQSLIKIENKKSYKAPNKIGKKKKKKKTLKRVKPLIGQLK